MHAAADRPEFAPPPQPGLVRGFALAVLAHLLLVFALMHGLQWQRESENAVAEAELWSTVPREVAPREQPAPPPTPPVVRPPPAPDPQQLKREADIALEREKQRRAEEKERREELARKREEERRKAEAQKKREEELARRKEEEARKVAEAKRKEEEKKKREQLEARDAKRREELRKEQLARVQAMAGTGGADATGNSTRAAGPSAGWGAKVQARVRPNIVFTDAASGNPKADVEVRMSPDGTIVGKRLVRSSGNKAWDEAVLRALERTGSLPRDDAIGRAPSTVIIGFRPND